MPRFKRYRRMVYEAPGDAVGPRRLRTLLRSIPAEPLAERWQVLQRHCLDASSRMRLERLFGRLGSFDPGIRESALAELDFGTRLIEAGASVRFLPESEARSADLDCRIENERFLVEVTAMIGAVERARQLSLRSFVDHSDLDAPSQEPGDLLTMAILARIHQKAKQLREYCDPVVLAISLPRLVPFGQARARTYPLDLDVKALIGAVSVSLPRLRHVSGVSLALWDVNPMPFKSGVRLGNASMVERSRHQNTAPRVRMLIVNPSADSPLNDTQQAILKQLL